VAYFFIMIEFFIVKQLTEALDSYYGAPQPSNAQPALEKQFEQYRGNVDSRSSMYVKDTMLIMVCSERREQGVHGCDCNATVLHRR
jgi:hypothetical protein